MATSDSDDDRPARPSDVDVLHDEQAVEDLIDPSRARGLWPRRAHDPNEPRPIAPPTRREQRQQRRTERRARRRRRRHGEDAAEDEAGLLYEHDGLVSSGASDDADSLDSLDAFSEKPMPRRTGRHRFRIAMIFVALVVLLLALLYGTYQTSVADAVRATPKVLRSNGTSLFAPTTILVSLDGFRADFLDRKLTPTLERFVREGVSPRYMLPSFPSLTFPNHWTLVTGLYPESHGVVGNSFWDPKLQEEFWYTDPAHSMNPKWWASTGAQPLWSAAEEQGVRAAVHMWPGSEAGVEPLPTYLDKYNGQEPLGAKVEKIFSLLDRPSEFDEGSAVASDAARPRFIASYVPNVDSDGHKYGPNSTEIEQAIRDADGMLETLFTGLEQRNLTQIVNVVVVSDHGMATTSIDRLYQLDELVDLDDIAHIDGWPLHGLRPRPGVDVQKVYAQLKARTADKPGLTVYLREDLLARWHFRDSDRIAPLWLVPDAGWAVVERKDFDVAAARAKGTAYSPKGLHGYDNKHPLMRAIFVARGPAFPHPPGSELAVFQNIEVYNIVCDSLGLVPRPNNGTLRLPLRPTGLHGQTPAAGEQDADAAPSEEELQEELVEEVKEEAQKLGFFKDLIHKFNETIHKIAGIFGGGSKKRQ